MIFHKPHSNFIDVPYCEDKITLIILIMDQLTFMTGSNSSLPHHFIRTILSFPDPSTNVT